MKAVSECFSIGYVKHLAGAGRIGRAFHHFGPTLMRLKLRTRNF